MCKDGVYSIAVFSSRDVKFVGLPFYSYCSQHNHFALCFHTLPTLPSVKKPVKGLPV